MCPAILNFGQLATVLTTIVVLAHTQPPCRQPQPSAPPRGRPRLWATAGCRLDAALRRVCVSDGTPWQQAAHCYLLFVVAWLAASVSAAA